MIYAVTLQFVSYCVADLKLSQADCEKISYSLAVIVDNASKLLILFVIFNFMGEGLFFVFSYLATLLFRHYLGGFHLKTYWGCLSFSACYFLVVWGLTAIVQMVNVMIPLAVYSVVRTAQLAPYQPNSTRQLTVAQKTRLKWRATQIASVFCVMPLFAQQPWLNALAIIVMVQVLLIHVHSSIIGGLR